MGVGILRVAGRLGTEFPEILQFAHRELVVAEEVEEGVEEHRAVAGGEDEAVAVRPLRGGRVDVEVVDEQGGDDVGRTHRKSRVAGFRRLDGVDREHADGIRHRLQLVHINHGVLGGHEVSGPRPRHRLPRRAA